MSLIEMLIALLIITVGLLGIAGLQAYSLKSNTSAYHRSQANALIYDIFDAMRANRESAIQGKYVLNVGESPSGSGRAFADLQSWIWRLQWALPAGTGGIACSGVAPAVVCTVTVRWDDTRRTVANVAELQEMTVSMML
jgi:type IV pilus assembly protein PilV